MSDIAGSLSLFTGTGAGSVDAAYLISYYCNYII